MVLWSARVKVTSVLITPPDQSGKGEGEPGVAQCSRGVRIVQDISQSQLKRRMYISMIDVLELRSDGMYDPRSRTFHVLFHGDVMVNAMQKEGDRQEPGRNPQIKVHVEQGSGEAVFR